MALAAMSWALRIPSPARVRATVSDWRYRRRLSRKFLETMRTMQGDWRIDGDGDGEEEERYVDASVV